MVEALEHLSKEYKELWAGLSSAHPAHPVWSSRQLRESIALPIHLTSDSLRNFQMSSPMLGSIFEAEGGESDLVPIPWDTHGLVGGDQERTMSVQ